MAFRMCVLIGAVGVSVFGSLAVAQPMPLARRTGGILVADTSTPGRIYLLRDANHNGSIELSDPAEAGIFFDATNASGVAGPQTVQSIFQSADGRVYFGVSQARTVYVVRDNNGDGDALDADEAQVWLNSQPGSTDMLGSPNGISADALGRIYVLIAGNGAAPADLIIRSADTDHDGSALSMGETSVWCDLSALVTGSSAFDLTFAGNTAYFADLRGSMSDVIYRAEDADGSNAIEAAELAVFVAAGDVVGGTTVASIGQTCISDGSAVFAHQAGSSTEHKIYKLTANANGTIASATEVWNKSFLPVIAGFTDGVSQGLAVGPGGDMAMCTNSGTRMVALLHDGDPNGSFMDAGDSTTVPFLAASTSTLRGITFYAAACKADFSANWSVTIDDLFLYINAYFLSDPKADVNGAGGVTIDDLFLYINLWFTGC